MRKSSGVLAVLIVPCAALASFLYIYIYICGFFKEQVALSLVMRDTVARTVFTTLIYIYRAEKKITVFSHIVKLCLAIFLIDLLHLSNSVWLLILLNILLKAYELTNLRGLKKFSIKNIFYLGSFLLV